MRLKPLHEQVAVIFGASSGIGRETALRFADQGAKLVVSARTEPDLEVLAREIRDRGGQALAVPAEVTEFEQVKAVADAAVRAFGRLDTWVHLAAVYLTASFDQTTPEEFRRIIDVNLNGAAYGAMAALPHLKREGRGALIHVSSVEAQVAFPYASAYAASKHGMAGFLDALRLELKHDGHRISVTNVMPATINTPLFSKARTKIGVKPQGAPPIYEPGVVADVILYAAEHPVREMYAGGAARAFALVHRISPKLADAYLLRNGFDQQRTDEPKSELAADNLYGPVAGQGRTEGDFTGRARRSAYTWLEVHPKARRGLGAGLGIAGLLVARMLRRR
jgi:NAD(P)-dependent dehydrogenase (short-subunit alcohol dehydrogenase family)